MVEFHVKHSVEHAPNQRICSRCKRAACETKGRYCRACRKIYMRVWRELVKARTPKRRRYRARPRIWASLDVAPADSSSIGDPTNGTQGT